MDKDNAVRSSLEEQFATQYDIASGADNSYTLTMKQSVVRDIETRALEQSSETIYERIDSLGVSEPLVEDLRARARTKFWSSCRVLRMQGRVKRRHSIDGAA